MTLILFLISIGVVFAASYVKFGILGALGICAAIFLLMPYPLKR